MAIIFIRMTNRNFKSYSRKGLYMGMGRKKSELKMRRRKSQSKLKARIARRIEAGKKSK